MSTLNRPASLDGIKSRLTVAPRYRDATLFVFIAVLFGATFIAIKTGLRELPPVLFAGLRFDIAAVALLGYVVVRYPRTGWLPRTRGDYVGIGIAAVFLIALNNGLLFSGQATTTPAVASVMYGLNPILAPVFAWWLLGDRLSKLGLFGIAVALGGVVLIVQPSPESLTDASAVGQLFVLGAAGAVALGSVWLQRIGPRMGSVPLTAWAMAAGAMLLHGVSLLAGESPTTLVGIGPATVLSLLVVGIPSTAVAYAIYFGLIGRVGPVRTNLVAYVVPIFAALMAWLVLGSAVSFWTVVGFLVVVAGFALIERQILLEEVDRFRRRGESESETTPPCDD